MFSDPVEIKKAVEYEKMSEADRLFKELGYEVWYTDNYANIHELQSEYKDRKNNVLIAFYGDKTFKKMYEGIVGAVMPPNITMQELKAINAYVEEHGWE